MPPDQPQLAAHPHRNQRLFSDHYLDTVLPELPEWKAGGPAAAELLLKIRALFDAFTPSTNEAQTENDLVRPILALLGHDFEVQPALKTPDGAKRPDYILYSSEAARQANKNQVLSDTVLTQALAVADAKYWERPLDQALNVGKDPFTNKNPGYQIAFYIQHTGLPWGILTNGRLWRLYHRDSAHKLDRYYEIDLPDLLKQGDGARLQYFTRFFGRAAFDTGPLSLSSYLGQSAGYARSIGESLRDQVYEALLHVAQGFLDFPRNGLSADEETLKRIYDNALILLYRLLFVLYAEDRELLPVGESSGYRDEYSLQAIKRSVAQKLKFGQSLLPSTCTVWPRLTALFDIINRGSPPLKVATFNGGLFDPARHPFLEENSVGDAHLQQAIDRLSRVLGEFVDYRDLSERHLGTIYEGLLEFHLHPLEPANPDDQAAAKLGWSVKLVTDKGERKSSGSYYTPGYITRFMVEHAVGPVVDSALSKAKTAGREAQVQAVLNINVLDCSMGSGHFLVETVEYLAGRLVEADLFPETLRQGNSATNELAYWKRRVAQSCIYGVDLNPLAVDLAKLSLWLTTAAKDRPLSFLDHHLRPGNALVGAKLDDLRPTTAFAKKPSKTAARKIEKAEAAGQLTWATDNAFTQSMKLAVGNMWLIEESPAATVADVKEQERQYETVRASFVRKYTRLADLVTATRFGLQINESLWAPLADYASGRTIAPLPQFKKWLAEADALSNQHHFFHWELEFPEVFFDRFGRSLSDEAGFDVVIGNPPYVRQERIAPLKPFLASVFAGYHSAADLYLYFYEQGIRLLQRSGLMAYISSGTFARANFARAFRAWLPGEAEIRALVDFGENQPFEGAEMVRPSIVVLTKSPQHRPFRTLFCSEKIPASLDRALDDEGIDCAPAALTQPEWTFQPGALTRLFEKVLAAGRPLAEEVNGRLYRGVLTGLNECFIVDEAARSRIVTACPAAGDLIHPGLRGEDLRPWYQENEGRWMIVMPSGWTTSRFGKSHSEGAAWDHLKAACPSLADHLYPHQDAARARLDKGEYWWELRSCDYYDAFIGPKLFWPDISKLPRFSWDTAGKYINNKGYIIPTDDSSLLALLQSRVIWFAISQICQPLRLRAGLWQYQLFTQFTSRLPIPTRSPSERPVLRTLADQATSCANGRYALHQATRHQIQRDLGSVDKPLNQRLTAWWGLDFGAFRAEILKLYKRDIPVKERQEWDEWLIGQKVEHQRLTASIVALETELNERVYRLFDLTPDEIRLVEETTKYPYGEV